MKNTTNKTTKYTVWVDGTEVNNYYLNYKEAMNLAFEYEEDGYAPIVVPVAL